MPGTVFRAPTDGPPFDHTSILATLLRWKGIDPGLAGLYDRVSVAPTFEGVLNSTIVNSGIDPPAPDCGDAFLKESHLILEGIPAAAKRYIALKAKSLGHMSQMAADYRLHRGI